MSEQFERLRLARERAGFEGPTDAATYFGWNPVTYRSHENGQRGLRPDIAKRYARAFKVSAAWLLTGEGEDGTAAQVEPGTVPLVGYVSAGAATHRFNLSDGELERVPAPEDATPNTVAVEIRGDSLGSFFDHWLVYYDDVRRPVTADLVGKLCVVGLADDGGTYIKKLKNSRARGTFHLYGQFGDPMLDVRLDWAARVKHMVPR